MAIFLGLIVGLLTAVYASNKGYNGIIWFFAGGVLGLIILLCLPKANDPYLSPHEQAKLVSNGNIVGGVIAALCIVAAIGVFSAGIY